MQDQYKRIFFSTAKYISLKNFFVFISGIFSILIVRLLGPAEFGKWSLVWQLIGTIGPIISFGFLSTLSRFLPECSENDRKNLFAKSFSIVLLVFAIFVIFYFLFFLYFPDLIPNEIKILKFPFLIFIGFVALINIYEGYYRGIGKFNKWSLIDGVRSFLAALVSFILLLVAVKKYEVIFYSYFFITAFFVFYFMIFKFKLERIDVNIQYVYLKFALIAVLGQTIFFLMSNINPFMLRIMLKDQNELGYYFAGIKLPQMIEYTILGQLATPFIYFFSNPDTKVTREKIIVEGTKYLSIIFGVISLILFSFSDIIITFLFSSKFNPSIKVLSIYSVWIFLFSIQVFVIPFFFSINKPFLPVFMGFNFFLLNAIINFFLIPLFKSQGAALASVISIFITDFIYIYFYSVKGVNFAKDTFLLILVYLLSVVLSLFTSRYLCFVFFICLLMVIKNLKFI